MFVNCTHTFLRQRNQGTCPICPAPPPPPITDDDLAALLQAAEQQQRKRLAAHLRSSLADFFRAAWPVLEPTTPLADNWHLDAFGIHLQELFFAWQRRKADRDYRPDLRNVLFNVPPGTSKSRFISVIFNAWAWTRDPSFTVIALSANPEVAKRDADFVKSLVESDWYRSTFAIDWVIREDKNAVGLFQIARTTYRNGLATTTNLGSRQSKGITSKITGQRADCLIVDDPHDAAEIKSEARRLEVLNKWDTAIRNRVNDNRSSIRIGVMQRLDIADWSAHVLKNKLQRWIHVCLPLRYDPSRDCALPTAIGWRDPRTTQGELLHPDRFDPEGIAADIEAMGLHDFEMQYDQIAARQDGGLIKPAWLRFFRLDEDIPTIAARPSGCRTHAEFPTVVVGPDIRGKVFDRVVLSVDATFKKNLGAKNSHTGLVVLGVRGPDVFWLEDHTGPYSYTEIRDKIQALDRAWRFHEILIEDKANGSALENDLAQILPKIVLLEPVGGKEARGQAALPMIRSGHLYLRDGAAWLSTAVEGQDSITAFPYGRRDDCFDALTQGILALQKSSALGDKLKRLGGM